MITKHGELFELFELRRRTDENRVSRGRRTFPDFINRADAQTRRINPVLSGRRDGITGFDFFQTGNVAHFKQPVFTRPANRTERI